MADEPYQFNERPPAKSSTGVLVSTPGAIACRLCGCQSLGGDPGKPYKRREGCVSCTCHGDEASEKFPEKFSEPIFVQDWSGNHPDHVKVIPFPEKKS